MMISPARLTCLSLTLFTPLAMAQTPPPTTEAPAAPATEPTTVPRPKLNPNARFLEDWSPLAKGDPTPSSFVDPIKYIPLTEDGEFWVSFGGQARMRYEDFRNFNFDGANDDGYLLFRLRAHTDLHFGEHVRVFIEGKSATMPGDRELPGGNRTLDVDELDLQQAFVDFMFDAGEADVTLRGGRQELIFGKQRLVSPLDWSNTRRTWDGARGDVKIGSWTASGFWTQFVPVEKYSFNEGDAQEQFYGIYATGKLPFAGMSSDLYILARDRDDIDEDHYTAGGRLWGKIGKTQFDYDLEGAYQFGDRGDLDVDAYFVAGEAGYTFAETGGKPRVYLGGDLASGDEDPADGEFNSFDQLYPLGHAYLGYIDVIGRPNIAAVHGGVSFVPVKQLTVDLTGHAFWRVEDADGLFNAGSGLVRAGGTSDENYVGAELDLTVKYQFNAGLAALFGYSHFFAGDFIEDTGPSEDMDFLYFQIEWTF